MAHDEDRANPELDTVRLYFALFNEIGIIGQLSRTSFEAHMPKGMNLPQFSVLNHLVRLGDGKAPLDLARSFQVPKTTMTHTLSNLEKHHLIETRPNPEDGRSKLVYLTAAGRSAREAAITSLGPDVGPLMEKFTPDRVQTLLPELAELRRILDESRD